MSANGDGSCGGAAVTRAQKWAQAALQKVQARRGKPGEEVYRTLCMRTPILFQQSGPVQGLAFLRARDEENIKGKDFVDDLAWVYGEPDKGSGDALLSRVQSTPHLAEYLALSRDLIEVSMWFRRFAQSELCSNVSKQADTERG